MTTSEKVSLTIQIFTLIAASYIGVTQNEINNRQALLHDYVAIAAAPDNSGTQITLLNTGTSNLYINKITMGDEVINYDRPRLLPTGTLESSYYWMNPPETLPINKDFDLKVYVTDEFGTKWVSEHAGQMHESAKSAPHKVQIWSYKTEKQDWQ